MALPGQDRFGYAVSELMQRMQIYGTYVLGVYEKTQPRAAGTQCDFNDNGHTHTQ